MQRRCIPVDNIDVKFVVETFVSGSLELLFSIIGNFTDDLKYREVEQCSLKYVLSWLDVFTYKC